MITEESGIALSADRLKDIAQGLLSYSFLLSSWLRSADAKIVSDGEKIIAVNEEVPAIFGYHPSELIGQPVDILVGEKFRPQHAENRAGYVRHPTNRPMSAGGVLQARHKDGHNFPVIINLLRHIEPSGLLVEATIRLAALPVTFVDNIKKSPKVKPRRKR